MEQVNMTIVALSGVFTLSLAFVLFYWFWSQYVVDLTRQQLFELREELFDMATAGDLERKGEAYQLVREMLNAALRFTHKLSLLNLLVSGYVYSKLPRQELTHIKKAIDSIPEEANRSRVREILGKMSMYLILSSVRRSLLALFVSPIIFILYIVVMFTGVLYQQLRQFANDTVGSLTFENAKSHVAT